MEVRTELKLFIRKTTWFILTFFTFYFISYKTIDSYLNNVKKNKLKNIYIWGDSQTYRGINLNILRKRTGNKVYSYAKHGAGVYDFLVFTERVPKYSTVIIGISKLVQLRPKSRDRNISGLSLIALYHLYQYNYKASEIKKIIKKNIRPKKIIQTNTKLYKINKSIVLKKSVLNNLKRIYKRTPYYLYNKQELYFIGIENLRKKHCNIIFVEFPYHEILQKIEANSEVKPKTELFKKRIINTSIYLTENDTLLIKTKKNVMYDLTHLNRLGARYVSLYLSKKLRKYKYYHYRYEIYSTILIK